MKRHNVTPPTQILIALLTILIAIPALAGGLADGEVIVTEKEVDGYDLPRVTAKGVINAPMEKVWNILKDCNNYTKTMQRVKAAKEIKRFGSGKIRCQVTLELPWPLDNLTAVTDSIHTEQPGKMYKRAWSLVSGDYEYNTGSWTLTPYKGDANKTLAVYSIHVKPKTSVPDAIKARAQKSALPDLFDHIRSQVE